MNNHGSLERIGEQLQVAVCLPESPIDYNIVFMPEIIRILPSDQEPFGVLANISYDSGEFMGR